MRTYKGQPHVIECPMSASAFMTGGVFIAQDGHSGYYKMASDAAGFKGACISWSPDTSNIGGANGAAIVGGAQNAPILVNIDATVTRDKVGTMLVLSGAAPCTTLKISGAAGSANIPGGKLVEYVSTTTGYVLIGADTINPGFTSL